MAALRAILSALRRAVGRDLAGIVKANNLLFLAFLGNAAEAMFVLLGLLLLFPLSSDPLERIPATRLALWPLSRGQRSALRLASFAFNPVAWVGAIILLKTRSMVSAAVFCGLVLVIGGAVRLGRGFARLRNLPAIPGQLGGLVRKDVREMLCLLDPYAALLLSIGGGLYRALAAHPDPSAFAILSLLTALAMSTCAQSLFGLELDSGLTRYHLLPLRGWEILLSKGIAFLAILLVLLLPLDPLPGLTFGLVALAFGHQSSIALRLPLVRWRFAQGSLPFGALQAGCAMAAGFLEHQRGVTVLALAALAYAASVHHYGRVWERS